MQRNINQTLTTSFCFTIQSFGFTINDFLSKVYGHPVNTGRGTTAVLTLHTSSDHHINSQDSLCLDDEDLCDMGSGAIFPKNSESSKGVLSKPRV